MKLRQFGSVVALSTAAMLGADGCSASQKKALPAVTAVPFEIDAPSQITPPTTLSDIKAVRILCQAHRKALEVFMEQIREEKSISSDPCLMPRAIVGYQEQIAASCSAFAHAPIPDETIRLTQYVSTADGEANREEADEVLKLQREQQDLLDVIFELQQRIERTRKNLNGCFIPSVIIQ